MPTPRVVSLLPSATEILCAIGGGGLLVGRSHECDFPAGLEGLPVLTASKTPSGAEHGAIDAMVREQLASGNSLYTLDERKLAELEPDVVLTQDLCEVCSIDLRTVERVAARLKRVPKIVSLNPHTFEGVLDDMLTVGGAVGLEAAAIGSVVRLRERMFAAGEFVNPFDDGPSLALLEWTDPLFCAGHWTVQLIERAGARHLLNPTKANPTAGAAAGPQHAERTAGKSFRVTPEALAESRPEIVIIAPCGVDLAGAEEAAGKLAGEGWWLDLPAVRNGRVFVVDGNQMFNRPGPRLVDAFEWLVSVVNGRAEIAPAGFPARAIVR